MPMAPNTSGTPVAAAMPEELDDPVEEPEADPPVALPVIEESIALCWLAIELASAFKELLAEPVAVAAAEEMDASSDEATELALLRMLVALMPDRPPVPSAEMTPPVPVVNAPAGAVVAAVRLLEAALVRLEMSDAIELRTLSVAVVVACAEA